MPVCLHFALAWLVCLKGAKNEFAQMPAALCTKWCKVSSRNFLPLSTIESATESVQTASVIAALSALSADRKVINGTLKAFPVRSEIIQFGSADRPENLVDQSA